MTSIIIFMNESLSSAEYNIVDETSLVPKDRYELFLRLVEITELEWDMVLLCLWMD